MAYEQNPRKLKLQRSRSASEADELRQNPRKLKLQRSRSEKEAKELGQNAMKLKAKEIRPHQNKESDDESGNNSNQLNMASASASDGSALERIKTMSINGLPSSSTSQINPLVNNHNAATHAASPTNVKRDLHLTKMAFAKAKDRIAYEQIIKGCEKLEKPKRRGSGTWTDKLRQNGRKLKLERSRSEREAKELRQNAMKLKFMIDSKVKILPHQNTESDDESGNSSNQLNMASTSDRLMHKLYGDPKFEHAALERIKVSFLGLPLKLKLCLLCFLNFPEKAIIKKRCLIYWWIGMGILPQGIGQEKTAEDFGNVFFDELIAKGFIEPLYKKCKPFLERCWMHPVVRSALTTLADTNSFDLVRSASTTLADSNGFDLVRSDEDFNPDEFRGWLNVDENVIDDGPELFAKMKHIKILYLGRWNSSTKHHIEIANSMIFDGLKNMEQLRFLCLRGISLITEIPEFISQLTSLKILDLRGCHNLEAIPKEIGFLKSLTHLDMSECYFLNHMPASLASLSELQVLKGFVIGDAADAKGRNTCTLQRLKKLQKLRKLNIYTNMRDFPENNDFEALKNFELLRKLTISWGGCSKQATGTEPKPSAGLPLKLVKATVTEPK